jgi:hypothetical protein
MTDVKLSLERVDSLCRRMGFTVGQMLGMAGVSRNAFYTLARKNSVVPQSLIQVAECLGVSVSDVLDEALTPAQRAQHIAVEANRIARGHRGADPENVRHTLLLLEEKPIERLRRALQRGRRINLR